MADQSTEALREKVADWQEQLRFRRISREQIRIPAFALAREVAFRTTGLRAYPEQLFGALALTKGAVAELATGEGKTLVAMLAAFLFALEGRGVHVVTVNSYLAERDEAFARSFFDSLGLTVGLLPERGNPAAKREAYGKDVTYGVGYEFGFDYLRDQLALIRQPKLRPTKKLERLFLNQSVVQEVTVQRRLAFAIIDEIDSVLIDEAGSPLVVAEASRNTGALARPYELAHQVAGQLEKGIHYQNGSSGRTPAFTREGKRRIDEVPDVPWDLLKRPWPYYVANSLVAREGYHKEEHYIIQDGKIVIVDEFTGRAHEERSWQRGLHQAVEVKESVTVQPEMESAASITRQRCFGLYQQICGLTGTASESAHEFRYFFKLPVLRVPLHRPNQRESLKDRVFVNQEAMLNAVVEEIAQRHATGQPVLLGTRTIQVSQEISKRLTERQISHQILTAKQDEEESAIVESAGSPGKVLVATNMAGRGTHIPVPQESLELGGLHVIGVERNESVRIDRQLIGRTARQGQPGSSQFFISADDALLTVFAPRVSAEWKNMPCKANGQLPGHLARIYRQVQRKAEKQRYQQRILTAKRDEWIDQTRRILG